MKNNKKNYRLFVHSFIVFFFLFPLGLAAFNYRMDPGHRYSYGVPEAWLKQLSSSSDLALEVPDNYDDRALLKKFIRIMPLPSIVLLGGSRVANIPSSLFKKPLDRQFLNAAVTSGTIRDDLAIWQMMKENNFRPKVVYICIERQSLSGASQNDKYLSLYEYYNAFFQQGLSFRVKFMGLTTDLKDLLSLQTTVASLKLLFKTKEKTGRLIPSTLYDTKMAAKTASFSLIYPKGYEERPLEITQSLGNDNGRGELKFFEKWNPQDRKGHDQLIALIRDIQRMGGAPVLIGMPYHPEAYRIISQNTKAYKNMEQFVGEIRRMANSERVFFYDAIIEHQADFSSQDFMDGVHLKILANCLFFKRVNLALGLSLVKNDP